MNWRMDPLLTSVYTPEARPTFITWKGYQRRSEVLAPLLDADVLFFPHVFRSKVLRPLDYLLKFIRTTVYLIRVRPPLVILQAPPLFAALAAILTKTRYIVDVHNALIQSFWLNVPLTRTFIRHATALIAHNVAMEAIVKETFPGSRAITISDPLSLISGGSISRRDRDILVICSFDYDEPITLLLDVVMALPEFTFTITADIQRLPRKLRRAFVACSNVRLTGFLSTAAYHSVLCSSKVAVVLTTLPDVQPSGACEALASNTPLIVTRSPMTEALFGEWATLADNSIESLVNAIRSVKDDPLVLDAYRDRWNEAVMRGIADLNALLSIG
ncbi:MAG: glycosyltransferase [Acidobacteriaceae bacterium]